MDVASDVVQGIPRIDEQGVNKTPIVEIAAQVLRGIADFHVSSVTGTGDGTLNGMYDVVPSLVAK